MKRSASTNLIFVRSRAPEWFNSAFTSKIKADVGSNWRLKVSNLKKIVDYILDYYQECLNQQLSNFSKPDVGKIGKKFLADSLANLQGAKIFRAFFFSSSKNKKQKISRKLTGEMANTFKTGNKS